MLATLTVRDETMFDLAGEPFVFSMNFPTEKVTVRELIQTRIRNEVINHNERQHGTFRGLVQPLAVERVLNGWKMPKEHKFIDWREQYEKAIAAFERNAFIVLVDDKQVENLDSIIEIKPQTSVIFLKLVPLVGG
ncbi:MAG: hypothetical protein M3209_03050 [Acidobacteriota bacterium]|nr:hypothetical protein [Acidobacteriota bacterium]